VHLVGFYYKNNESRSKLANTSYLYILQCMTLLCPEFFVTVLINFAAPVTVSLSVRPSVCTRMRKREMRKYSHEILYLRILPNIVETFQL